MYFMNIYAKPNRLMILLPVSGCLPESGTGKTDGKDAALLLLQ